MNGTLEIPKTNSSDNEIEYDIPTTRYIGSKRRFLDFLHASTKHLVSNDTVALDLFGGSGIVSYHLKRLGATVFYNDYLRFNWWIGKALIENDAAQLSKADIDSLLEVKSGRNYPSFIQDTFIDCYYTDAENKWLDIVSTNIRRLRKDSKKAAAYYALFQACMIKRPWNIFNRANLSFRFEERRRSFGNKTTWDTPFEEMFRRFCKEINAAAFGNEHENRALNERVEDMLLVRIRPRPDIVYIDPPSGRSPSSLLDYYDLYHFLEGLAYYEIWGSMIDPESPIKGLTPIENSWSSPDKLKSAWKKCLESFSQATLIISYRSPGFPKLKWLETELKAIGKDVEIHTKNGTSRMITPSNQRPDMYEHIMIAQ